MLRRYSRRTNLAGVYRFQGDNPTNYWGLDIANTDEPANYVLPAFQITIQRRNPPSFLGKMRKALDSIQIGSDPYDVYARLTMTRNADQGTNDSVYLGEGIYETNGTLDLTQARANSGLSPANYAAPWSQGKTRIYLVVSSTTARKNKRAEEEHLADFIYAYQRTLGVAQQALEAVRNRWYGPYDEEEEAREAVKEAFLAQVPQKLKRLGMDMNAWRDEYLRLCQKSRDRDGQRWHSFGVALEQRRNLPNHIHPTYLTGVQRAETGRVYLKLTDGQTQIGLHPPAQVITYD